MACGWPPRGVQCAIADRHGVGAASRYVVQWCRGDRDSLCHSRHRPLARGFYPRARLSGRAGCRAVYHRHCYRCQSAGRYPVWIARSKVAWVMSRAIPRVEARDRPLLPAWVSRLVGDRLAVVGMLVIVPLVILTFAGPMLAPYGPDTMDYTATLQSPTFTHWLGTDDLGRDILVRTMVGGQLSLSV